MPGTSVIDIPFESGELEETPVYRTYRMDMERKRIIGMTDREEAVLQAIWKILSTRRFAYLIYDDQYGSDVQNKMHDTGLTPEYLDSDIPAMVEEALTQDERITGISDFAYEILSKDSVHVRFTAETIYGELQIEGVVGNGGEYRGTES